MATPIAPSTNTQQLIAAAGQAAANDAAAAQQVTADQAAIASLNTQLQNATSTLTSDQAAAGQADSASQQAYIQACQAMATDFAIPLPLTIPAPVIVSASGAPVSATMKHAEGKPLQIPH